MRSTSAFSSGSDLVLVSNPQLNSSLNPAGDPLPWRISAQYDTLSQRSSSIESTSSNIAFIDATVPDYQTLIASLQAGTEIYILNPLADAVTQIGQILAGRSQISSLHIISHGQVGRLHLGTTSLDRHNLDNYASQLQSWARALTTDADILLYGCNVAQDEQGRFFVEQLSQLTGADIAASDDRTGNSMLEGNWILEFATGEITALPLFQTGISPTYQAVLDGTYFNLAAGNFSQNWSNPGLIITNDDWSGVPSIIGYRGDSLTGVIGTNPQTIVADGSATPINVMANQTNPNTLTTGGIAEFNLANPTVALQASGTADAPHLVLHLDATGQQNVRLSLTLRDIDHSTDNAITPIAIQYRISNTGNFINLPDSYIPDATLGTPTINAPAFTREIPLTVLLPTAVNNQSQIQVRILTTNAVGNDEWIGIDDLQVTSTAIATNTPPIAVADSYSVPENSTLTTAPSVTLLLLDSDSGNYIGQSDYYRYAPYTGVFNAIRNADNGIRISYLEPGFGGHWWYLDFAAPNNQLLTPGTYTGATRYPFQGTAVPGLSVSGDGRGYNTLTGEFTINQVVYGTGNQIISFDATFQEYGDGDPITESLQGRIQYRATTGLLPGVLANDSDAEGTNLTVTLVSAPGNGTLTFNANGSFVYTPNPGFSGIDTFTYIANDTIANSTPTIVTINVIGANDPPVHTLPATITTDEDTPFAFTGTNTISITDADAGTNPIRTTLTIPAGQGILNLTAQAGLTITGNGTNSVQLDGTIVAINNGLSTLTYTPPANANSTTIGGTVALTIVSNDQGNAGTGGALTDTDTILITINPINDAPIANHDAFSTTGTPLTIPAPGVLSNDTDWENNPLQAILVMAPTQGTLNLNVDGSLTYTPRLGFGGTDQFTYRVNDGTADSNIATVTLNVNAPPPIVTLPEPVPSPLVVEPILINSAPVLTIPDRYSMEENQRRLITGIQVNDVNAGDRPIQLSLAVSKGTLSLIDLTGVTVISGKNNSRNLTIMGSQTAINRVLKRLVYRSAKKFRGTDAITLTVNDLHGSHPLTTQRSIAIAIGRKFRQAKVKGKQGIKRSPKRRN